MCNMYKLFLTVLGLWDKPNRPYLYLTCNPPLERKAMQG